MVLLTNLFSLAVASLLLQMCKLLFTHFARGQLTARELFLTVQRWVKLHPTTPPTPRQMRRCIDKLVDEELYEDARRVTVLASRVRGLAPLPPCPVAIATSVWR